MTDTSLFDDILDTNLDDIADLPEYLDFCPTGHYTLEIVEAKQDTAEVEDPDDKNKKVKAPVLRVTYELVSIGELKDDSEAALVKTRERDGVGSRFSETFFFHKDKKKTAEIVKAKYKEIAAKFGYTDMRALVEGLKGISILAMVSSQQAKDKQRYFINTKNIQPL